MLKVKIMVDYKILKEMLEEALAKETGESWNQFLDDCYTDSHLIDTVSSLDVSTFIVSEPMTWSQGNVVAKKADEIGLDSDRNNPYAIAA